MRAASCISVQNDVQAAEFGHAEPELDVGSAAGHVRRDGDPALRAGLGHDLGLGGDMIGVEHLVLDAALGQQRERMSDLSIERVPMSTGRPCSCRWQISSTTAFHLASFRTEDLRPQALPDGRPVGGNGQHVAAIDPPQFAAESIAVPVMPASFS
jgi:hypothetical protein